MLHFNPPGAAGFIQLNATYSACIQAGILDKITTKCDEALNAYEVAQAGRLPDGVPTMSLEEFKNHPASPFQPIVNTFFYKVATSGILPLIVEKVSGTDLSYDLFKSPDNLSLKLPREVYDNYERDMRAFIDNYRVNVNNYLLSGGADINTLTIKGVEPGEDILQIIRDFTGKTNEI